MYEKEDRNGNRGKGRSWWVGPQWPGRGFKYVVSMNLISTYFTLKLQAPGSDRNTPF